MNWRNYGELMIDTIDFAKKWDKPDLVVGIARSGIIPATILALHWNVSLCSLQDYINGQFSMGCGLRYQDPKEIKNVMIVDDSIRMGGTIAEAKRLVKKANFNHKVGWAVIYADDDKDYENIIFHKTIRQGRMFQWNWISHKEMLSHSVWDIDGCMCVKPTVEQNDDGEKYRKFLLNAPPLYLPQYPINGIVTSRLEKFRPETEQWLKKHNVKYKELIMLNYPTGRSRRMLGHHAHHKAMQFKVIKSSFFVEDELWQAEEIHKITGKHVLCLANWRLYK